MATTQLTDIFVGDYYASLAPVNSPEKTAVYESGIVTRSPVLDGLPTGVFGFDPGADLVLALDDALGGAR